MTETHHGTPTWLSKDEYAKIMRMRKELEHEEYKYLHLLQDILDNGIVKTDRTGVGTKSIFGTQLKFDLSKSFPILTTKKVFFKGVIEELLWFIRGETDSKKLEAKGVKIWVGNTSRDFLDKKGLDYPEGEIGPGYGFQWRHWGAAYNGSKVWENSSDYGNTKPSYYEVKKFKAPYGEEYKGIDQLAKVVETIRKNPNDRRMIVSAWNVADIDRMALPPCHLLFQFDVSDGKLNCQWTQRSVDSFLGLPFNVSSYALMTYLIAKITNLQPGTLTFSGGDTHIYLNHIEQCKEQISRTPYQFPQLNIKRDIKELNDIENLNFEDIELIGYKSHATIKADMAV
jgi:thymidylate synthase